MPLLISISCHHLLTASYPARMANAGNSDQLKQSDINAIFNKPIKSYLADRCTAGEGWLNLGQSPDVNLHVESRINRNLLLQIFDYKEISSTCPAGGQYESLTIHHENFANKIYVRFEVVEDPAVSVQIGANDFRRILSIWDFDKYWCALIKMRNGGRQEHETNLDLENCRLDAQALQPSLNHAAASGGSQKCSYAVTQEMHKEPGWIWAWRVRFVSREGECK